MSENLSKNILVNYEKLQNYCDDILVKNGIRPDEAKICSEILVESDLRGIPSHGVARLDMYLATIKDKIINADGEIKIIKETPNTLLVDGNFKLGQVVGCQVMQKIIDKANKTGISMATVKNSNHYGIAGHYAMMGLSEGMLGISMTNSPPLGIPTFGTTVKFGSNPIAFAAPANLEKSFVLDMSTTVVTRGKVEVYSREEKMMPDNWTVGKDGLMKNNPTELLADMESGFGGGILPLGGFGEILGGHKGYGLGVMVDILCGVLAGSEFADDIKEMGTHLAPVSHFFAAIKIENFRDINSFKSDMDKLLHNLRTSSPAKNQDRVYYAGLKEYEAEEFYRKNGLPILDKVYQMICNLGQEVGLGKL
ncbi:MAG: Ldh family oxidoreductase [Fusobacteriaceae bacterium]